MPVPVMSLAQSVGIGCDELSGVATVMMVPLIAFEFMIEKRLVSGLAMRTTI